MKIVDKKITLKVRRLFKEWAKSFRTDIRKDKFFTYYERHPLFVKEQIEFIQTYLGYMLIDGTTPENLKRIKRFLSMQKIDGQ
ncbi:MAG: hypothetical protein Q8P40_13170 [Nitrospirota bacterium]|nr:hypothetical protein [Nitrospirota bacterium]